MLKDCFNKTLESALDFVEIYNDNRSVSDFFNWPDDKLWTNEFCRLFVASAVISYLMYFGIGGFLHVSQLKLRILFVKLLFLLYF